MNPLESLLEPVNHQPAPPNSQLNAEPPTASQRQRNGKVARLPKEIRTRINQMLDDGLPFHQIIENLGAQTLMAHLE